MYTIPIKKNEQIAMKPPFFWAVLGDLGAREPRLHSEISDFRNLNVLGDFLCINSHCMTCHDISQVVICVNIIK